jgi:hypothetical protein
VHQQAMGLNRSDASPVGISFAAIAAAILAECVGRSGGDIGGSSRGSGSATRYDNTLAQIRPARVTARVRTVGRLLRLYGDCAIAADRRRQVRTRRRFAPRPAAVCRSRPAASRGADERCSGPRTVREGGGRLRRPRPRSRASSARRRPARRRSSRLRDIAPAIRTAACRGSRSGARRPRPPALRATPSVLIMQCAAARRRSRTCPAARRFPRAWSASALDLLRAPLSSATCGRAGGGRHPR